VVAQFILNTTGDSTAPWGIRWIDSTPTTIQVKKDDFKNAFKRADSFGLRLIPEIQIGDCHGQHWEYARRYWNSDIKMTRIRFMGGDYGCPSFTEDSAGIDKTFPELLGVIRDAYDESGVRYPLEFIHVGHDEPAAGNFLLMGSCKTGRGCNPGTKCSSGMQSAFTVDSVLERCAADMRYIRTYPGTKSEAVQSLFVTELFRRIKQVQAVFGSRVKVMIHGDVLDPSFFNSKYVLWTNDTVTLTPGIGNLPGLSGDSEKKKFRDNLIVMPWNYDKCAGVNMHEYSADTAFSYLTSKGFKFIYVHSYFLNDNWNLPQTQDWHDASLHFTSNCLGYDAASWEMTYLDSTKRPYPSFNILDSLHSLNAAVIPPVDFVADSSHTHAGDQ
jgi:hypothetical protein